MLRKGILEGKAGQYLTDSEKSECPLFVIPEQAGIHSIQTGIDPRLPGSGTLFDFLLAHQN